MASRTFVVGDIHGEIESLLGLLAKLPALDPEDTLVFLGDYVDRGPRSKEVVSVVRELSSDLACKVVCLRGNHEDAWLRVVERGWPEFVLPASNGCHATRRSFLGQNADGDRSSDASPATRTEWDEFFSGAFLPSDVVEWMRSLPYWYEDEHAIYVHAGLVEKDGVFPHPRDVEPQVGLLWTRTERFFREYRGKRVVVGHTVTELLPPELSHYTPDDPKDLWAGESVIAIDTGCGSNGFLTAVELPALVVYESR